MIITYKNTADSKTIDEDIVKLILNDRNIINIDEFLHPASPTITTIEDFGFKKEIRKTIKLLEKIKKDGSTIIVYTDYDADGITGGTILWETLNLLGFKVKPYVPHRKLEGYGFSKKGLDHVKREFDPALIISVDHGIAAPEKISYAKSIGIPVVITDHHLKTDVNPDDAVAIFHVPELSGAGVSYFFSKALFEHFKDGKNPYFRLLTNNFSSDYLSLAAIGIVADLVPLVGPSRSVVKFGLDAFPKVKRVGLKHIMIDAGIENRVITPYEIGFMIAPRINAVGRLEHAIDALRLLCTTSEEKAADLAHSIGVTNQTRQDLVKKAVEEAKKQVEKQIQTDDLQNIIILTSDSWHEGIIGLIASKIAEEYYRPTIVMTRSDGFLKGSARSIPNFDITTFLRSLEKNLVDVGGHAQAAGFTIEATKLDKFIKEANKSSKKLLKPKDLEKKRQADLKIQVSQISKNLVKLIESLYPFGIGNPQPVFYSEARIVNAQVFGKKNEHLKIFVADHENDSFPLELIAFSKAQDYNRLSIDQKVEVVYQAEIDRWGGNERLRGRLLYWQ